MKKLLVIITTSLLLIVGKANAEMQFGISAGFTKINASGSETEGTAADTSDRSKSFDELFFGADVFMEFVSGNGTTYGVSYVPVDFELGSGERTDSNGNDPAENDDGTRTASADVSDLITLYANFPMGSNGWYALAGYHMATITTAENVHKPVYSSLPTLPTSPVLLLYNNQPQKPQTPQKPQKT